MAGVVFSVVLAVTITRAVLVVDAVYLAATGTSSGAVARATQAIHSKISRRSSCGATAAVAVANSRVRALHQRLLAMHLMAILTTSAGVAKYMLPVSDTSCLVAHRAMVSTILLYDATLVLFLLAKTSVTNGNRALAKWEIVITWWSRFYAWAYLPMSATFLALYFPGSASKMGPYCFNRFDEEGTPAKFSDTIGFSSNNAMLIVQFVLLLAMFVKPMLIPQSSQSGGAMYRRVVLRNVVCTVGVVFTYMATTLVVVLALLAYSPESNKADQVADVTPVVNILMTLCLTEIALPLGFSSCLKSVRMHSSFSTSQREQVPPTGVSTIHTKRQTYGITRKGGVKGQAARLGVVPSEEDGEGEDGEDGEEDVGIVSTEVVPFDEPSLTSH